MLLEEERKRKAGAVAGEYEVSAAPPRVVLALNELGGTLLCFALLQVNGIPRIRECLVLWLGTGFEAALQGGHVWLNANWNSGCSGSSG